jgi:hypothetical protein
MDGQSQLHIVLVDSDTATALAQILPVLLLTLTVELRRTQLHRQVNRLRLAVFSFVFVFGSIETILVLSIDGAFYPFQWFDICSALIIFGLLALLVLLSLTEPRNGKSHPPAGHTDEPETPIPY